MFDIVVAADLDWAIGNANALPWPKLRGDLAHFKRVTSAASEGKRAAVIMGRKTWESAEVAGKPLPRRLNIVVTHRAAYAVAEGARIAGSLDAALALAADASDVEATFVVGGAALFREAFVHPELRFIFLTRVQLHCGGDTYIPELDRDFTVDPTWDGEQDTIEDNGVRYRIERLVRR
ncbi:MAG: dihydrofolate reductase [Kofleriaceae bacterium]